MEISTVLIISSFMFFCCGLFSQEKLVIEGAMKIGDSKEQSPVPGTIRWTGSDLQGWNGSNWVSLVTNIGFSGEISDVEGNIYPTIIIGSQEWMAENLRTSKYQGGSSIPQVIDNDTWSTTTAGAWCWYLNDNSYEQPHGMLYNWYVVSDSICPMGWHIPSDNEWTTLTNFLGGEDFAGGSLKEGSFDYWRRPNKGATNSTGFSGLPGIRNLDGSFGSNGFFGYWWSSTESGSQAWDRGLFYDGNGVVRANDDKGYGFWIRCVKD